jgi:hypothetical protein
MIAALHGDKGRLIGSYAQRQPSRPIRRRRFHAIRGANRGIGNRFALPARNLGVRLHAGQSARGVRRFRGAADRRRTRRSPGTAIVFGFVSQWRLSTRVGREHLQTEEPVLSRCTFAFRHLHAGPQCRRQHGPGDCRTKVMR